MNKNYAILNLRIPLEIFETGKYKLYKDRMDIGIERCTELPCQKNNSDYRGVLEVISEMFQETGPREKIKWQGTGGTGDNEDTESSEGSEYTENTEGSNEDSEGYELESTIDYGNESEDTEGTEGTEGTEQDKIEEENTKKIIELEPELRVYPHEIKPRHKNGTLMTFKNRIKPKNTFTRKLLI